MSNKDTVLSKSDVKDIDIQSVSHRGEGIGRYAGMAVFVPFTIPGEKVTAKITEVKKNYARAALVEVVCPSRSRIEPRCRAFSLCGGSQLQHIDYDSQLEIKKKIVEDSLQRIGGISYVEVKPVLGMENPWHYRNKAQFQVRRDGEKIRLGFFEEGTHDLVPAAGCVLMNKEILNVAALVEKMINRYDITAYDWGTGFGFLRHVVIRRSWQNGEIMVVFVTSGENANKLKLISDELMVSDQKVVSIVQNINRSKARQVFGRNTILIAGKETIADMIGTLNFKISAQSFFQVNPQQTEVLYDKALEYANLKGDENVLDVYCGIGTLSLFLARKAKRVYGFESVVEAINDAHANASLNSINNVDFVSGKAEETLPGLVKKNIHPDVVVVDPPRQGVEKRALKAIIDMNPERIVYVSCDPATLARDLGYLQEHGYKVQEVQPVDMFPQTSHVECIVLIKRAESRMK